MAQGGVWNDISNKIQRGCIHRLDKLFYFLTMCKASYQALTDIAQVAGCRSAKREVTDLIPGQNTCLDSGFGPWLGHV